MKNLREKGDALGHFLNIAPEAILKFDLTWLEAFLNEITHWEDIVIARCWTARETR